MNKIKLVLTLSLITITQFVFGQDFSNSWTGHFSYLNIKDISQGTSKIFGAAENAVFIYDTQTSEIQKLSTVNGLSGETISSIYYAEENEALFIGFENGLIQIYFESNQDIKTVVDIVEKPTIPSNKKRINHFNIYNGYAYISTNYGISLYDINNLEFGDTYFIGANGSQIITNQLTILEDTLYAATEAGIFKADASNPNLIDYQQWIALASASNWVGVQAINQKLFAARNNTDLFEIVSGSFNLIENYTGLIQDLRNFEDKLVVTTINEVYVYNADSFTEIATVVPSVEFNTKYSCATITENDEIFIGTKKVVTTGESGFGILKTTLLDTQVFEEIHPESPLSNNFFQIRQQSSQLWGTHGGFSVSYGWNGGVQRTGISHLINNEWQNISYDSLTTVSPKPWYLSYLSINPFNPDEVYVGSYYSGLIKRTPESLDLYNQDNSTITPFVANFHLTLASKYDTNGDLWVMAGRTHFAINKFSNENWNSFSLQEIIDPANSNNGFSSIEFDANNNAFIGSRQYGLIGFKENNGNPIIKNISGTESNVPSGVRTIAIDKQNQLWFGTTQGLRVVYNTDEFFNDPNYQPSEIIILDNGVASELFFQQFLTDIEVDGANNKWVATLDTGAYYLSNDGQETIYHFTKDNSPLPTNAVLDIAIDKVNGKVYFATDKGLVAFNSETSAASVDFEDAYIYPNPVRPNFNINDEKIKIKGLTENVNIKITDIEGNLVTEAETKTNTKFKGYNLEIDGGTALWNGKNLANQTVATGVYMVMITDLDSFETKVLKVMVVR